MRDEPQKRTPQILFDRRMTIAPPCEADAGIIDAAYRNRTAIACTAGRVACWYCRRLVE